MSLLAFLGAAGSAMGELIPHFKFKVAPRVAGAPASVAFSVRVDDTTRVFPNNPLPGFEINLPEGAKLNPRAVPVCESNTPSWSQTCPSRSQVGSGTVSVWPEGTNMPVVAVEVQLYNASPLESGDRGAILWLGSVIPRDLGIGTGTDPVPVSGILRVTASPSSQLLVAGPSGSNLLIVGIPAAVQVDLTLMRKIPDQGRRQDGGRNAAPARPFFLNPPSCKRPWTASLSVPTESQPVVRSVNLRCRETDRRAARKTST